jgi:predicted NBD/HSP70 family sugar kinase
MLKTFDREGISAEPQDSALPTRSVLRPVSEGGRRVLNLLLKSGGMSQAQLTHSLDLSQPSIARLLKGFLQDGMVQVAPRPSDHPGKPSLHVSLNPDFAYSLGISMLGDKLAMTLMDFAGGIRGECSAAMPSMSEAAVIGSLKRFKTSLIAESGIDPRRMIGAGVGLSAYFVGESGEMNPPAYLDDWALRDIAPVLGAVLDLPVVVDNDASLATIGESLYGVGSRCSNFAYLHLTNGFGGGHIVDGKPFRGYRGNAGEFGGIWSLVCDTYPNLDLLRECVAAAGHSFETVEDMVKAIDLGWPGVEDWLEKAAPVFSKLCEIIAFCNDPQMIVIGGRLPRSIAEALRVRITLPREGARRGIPQPVPEIVVAEVVGDPVSIGGAAAPLRSAFFI